MNKMVSFDIPIISKEEAKAKGLNKFFTGEECDHGHIDFRYTSDGRCKSCMAISSKKYKSKNYEKVVALHRKAGEAWRSRNIEINRERNRLWKQNNKAMVAFMNAGSRERKKTKLTKKEINEGVNFYRIRDFINGFFDKKLVEVDHIMPLSKGGRHHPKNLQILSWEENSKKWNHFRSKDQLLWLENHFGDLPATKARKERFKTLKLNIKNV